ncbi:hypothetical protein CEXT_51381 [Caerostris extrusa]|uniref:WAP domain-containing protein n=1 Tax=Caerostris extrusa TaxID=172846 RepID=A0AAV4S9H2_CAEEX|nr:hypothetical protein CEXT_51381 [Caerostris extrusa]
MVGSYGSNDNAPYHEVFSVHPFTDISNTKGYKVGICDVIKVGTTEDCPDGYKANCRSNFVCPGAQICCVTKCAFNCTDSVPHREDIMRVSQT